MPRERQDVVAVGLTGGIGAGKSTALTVFEKLGVKTISADNVVHDLYGRPEVASRVAARFGRSVLDADGHVDRVRLAKAVRERRRKLRWLEKLIHPLVAHEIAQFVRAAPKDTVVVCEVPLLFETGFEEMFDLVVTVEAGPEARRRRSKHRFDLDQFAEFERLQASSERRVEESDLVYYNDGTIEDLEEFVRRAHGRAVGLLKEVK